MLSNSEGVVMEGSLRTDHHFPMGDSVYVHICSEMDGDVPFVDKHALIHIYTF